MWPASALLTGNGVAFVLRVPGTEHGDWWSLNGWWIFAGTAAVALLSKHLIVHRGRHVFNPSNFGLVLCFLLLGPERADPLAFWWGPLSPWLVLALALIVGGGLAILSRLRLLVIAVTFWLTFAAGVGVLAASGHEMTASWHLGPIAGWELWRVLVTSPEILVFLFFMITDPRTTPASQAGRRAYAIAVGFLAALLIAPWTSEFSAKVAVLAALALVCAARVPLVAALLGRRGRAAARAARPAGVSCRSPGSARPSPAQGSSSSPGCRPDPRPPRPLPRRSPRRCRRSPSPRRPGSSRSARRAARTIAAALVAALDRRGRRTSRARRSTRGGDGDGSLAGGLWAADRGRARAADRRPRRTSSNACGCGSCRAPARGRRRSSPARGARLDDDLRGATRARDCGAPSRARRPRPSSSSRRTGGSCSRPCAAPPEPERRSPAPCVVHAHRRGRRGRPRLPPRRVPLRHRGTTRRR